METVKNHTPLKPHNTLAISADAEYFSTAKSIEEIISLLNYAKENNLEVTILGGGSNVLISDAGIKGLVIKNDIDGISYDSEDGSILATVGAGVLLDDLVADTVAKGYWGLENLSHIPGTVGATPVQNVGAYGVEVSDLIKNVIAVDINNGEIKKFTNKECNFGYRDSFFKTEEGRRYVITEVVFNLSTTESPQLTYGELQRIFEKQKITQAAIREVIIKIRSKKFPDWHKVGTAGSFFKNPFISKDKFLSLKDSYPDLSGFYTEDGQVKIPLGWVLEHICNLRDYRQGNVGTYEGQALVVVNYGGATAEEIVEFTNNISSIVKEKTGIQIEREVTAI